MLFPLSCLHLQTLSVNNIFRPNLVILGQADNKNFSLLVMVLSRPLSSPIPVIKLSSLLHFSMQSLPHYNYPPMPPKFFFQPKCATLCVLSQMIVYVLVYVTEVSCCG